MTAAKINISRSRIFTEVGRKGNDSNKSYT